MATAEIKVVTLEVSKLQEMLDQSADKAVAKYIEKQRQEGNSEKDLVSTTELIELEKYGKSRTTIAKYRDQIIAENPNQSIVIKHGKNYMFDLNKFNEWFINHNEAHDEALKLDPRLRR